MRNHTYIPSRAGFTLFELALGLVVVALIIGAVLGGEAMMQSARLQSVIEDTNSYIKAVQMFKDKYHELPGDMPNATDFWGTDPGGCPVTPANITPKIATCNGNGDGFIGHSTTPIGLGGNTSYETYRAWQHLADAGFIKGEYTGALSSTPPMQRPNPGTNIPASKITGNGFTLIYVTPLGVSDLNNYSANYRHILVYGAPQSANQTTWSPGLTPADAWSIDQKMDDGVPNTGTVMSYPTGILPNCTNAVIIGNTTTTTYRTNYTTGPACSLIFITGF